MTHTSPEALLRTGLLQMGLACPEESLNRIMTFSNLLLEKNRVMNLTAITDPFEVAEKHMLDSLAILCFYDFSCRSVIDVGCGAGFPGLPIKLFDPALDISLLDSQQKRLDFLSEVLAAVSVPCPLVHARAEEAAGKAGALRERFDIALSRAVAPLNSLCELTLPFVRPGGMLLAYKSTDCDEEIHTAGHAMALLGAGLEKIHTYTLSPSGITRRILAIRKHAETPDRYPRRFAKIKSAPL